jgi:hypothetical protein
MSTPTGPNTSGQPLPQPDQPGSQPGQPYPPSYGAGQPPTYPGQPSYPAPPSYPGQPTNPGQPAYTGPPTGGGQVPPPGTYSVAGGQQPPGGSYFPPAAPGTDPGQQFPGQPAEPVKKKNPKWVWPLVAVIVVAVGVGLWLANRSSVSNAEVGDCIVVQSDTDFKKVDCTSADAEYKVISIDETDVPSLACNDDNVDASIYTKGSGDQKSWCLQGVWQEGDCLKGDGSDSIDCATATSSDLKVLKVLEGTQDEQGCPADSTTYRTYTDANKVLCLAEAK